MKLVWDLRWGRLVAFYRSDFVRKIAETFATRVFIFLISLFASIVTTRALGPVGRGEFAAALAGSQLITQFGNLGLHASNTYYIARDRSLLTKLLGNSLLVSFGWGGVLMAGMGIFFWFSPDLAPVKGTLLLLALLSIAPSIGILLVQNLLIGIYEIRQVNTIQSATKILNVGFLVLLVWVGIFSAEVAFLAGLTTGVIEFGWSYWRVRQRIDERVQVSLSLMHSHLGYGFKAYLAALFSFMVIRLDILMVQYMRGSEELGYYSLAVTIINMLLMLPTVVGSILFPKLSGMTDPDAKWQFTQQVALIIGGLMLVGTLLAMPLAGTIIKLMYGETFLPAVAPFRWLLIGLIFLSVNTVFQNYFGSVGNPIVVVVSPFMATLLNITVNLFLIPRYGIVGAALSSTLAYGLMLVASLLYLTREYLHKRYKAG